MYGVITILKYHKFCLNNKENIKMIIFFIQNARQIVVHLEGFVKNKQFLNKYKTKKE